MNQSGTYLEVVRVKGVQPFLWTQFQNAFNDNLYKIAVSLLAVIVAGGSGHAATYLSIAGFIFVAPYLLFSGYAGQLADRYEKRSVIIATKVFEIAAMTLATFALWTRNIEWMLGVLFFSATQAAVFSPAKYGIVPELVEERQIARANGLLEMSTFVAVILGTIAGSALVAQWKDHPANIGFVLISIAVIGTLLAVWVAPTRRQGAARPFSWNPFGDVLSGVERLREDVTLRLTVTGTTYFWFLGALFQMLVLLLAKEALHAGETQSGLLVASLAIGIGGGSMAAGRISSQGIEPRLIPIGALGMSIGSFILAGVPANLISAGVLLAFIGAMGGLYIVPLNAILQHRPAPDEKGRVIATANVINTIGIMIASGVLWVLHEGLHLSAAGVIGVSGVLTLGAAWYSSRLVTGTTDSLPRRFSRSAKRHWKQPAITDSTGRSLTYGEALAASLLGARRLKRAHAQERMIGIMLPATAAGALTNLAVSLARLVPVNLNFTLGREALDSMIGQCSIRTVFTSREFLKRMQIEPRAEFQFVEDLFSFGKLSKTIAYMIARLLPAGWLSGVEGGDDLAAVLFSSGSAGAPKGVMLSHTNLLSNVDSVNQLYTIDATQTLAGVLPFFHSFGFTFTLWFPLLNGARAAYHPQPLDAKGVGQLVEKSQATFLPAPPTFIQAYIRGCSKEQFASVRYIWVGAEKLQPHIARAFEEKFGFPLIEGYGVTEMSPAVCVNRRENLRPGTIGPAIPGVEAKIVHTETGEDLPVGEAGMLLVKGPNRMIGYLNRPEETSTVFHGEWYVTGDIALMDAEGFVKIVDRQSRFSKIAGEMVPHGRIEQALQDLLPGVVCVITAVPDPRKGERLVAFVAAENSASTREIWQGLVSSGLPNLWVPKLDDIHKVDSLPALASGKLDLRAIKEMARQLERTPVI